MCQTIEPQSLPRISVKGSKQSEVCETCNSVSHANTSYPDTYSHLHHHRYHASTSERLHTPLTHSYTTDTTQVHGGGGAQCEIAESGSAKNWYTTDTISLKLGDTIHQVKPHILTGTPGEGQKHFKPHILTSTPQIPGGEG